MVRLFVLCCMLLQCQTFGEKILLVPVMHYSHLSELLALGQALSSHGHEVHVIISDLIEHNKLQLGNVKPLTYHHTEGIYSLLSKGAEIDLVKRVLSGETTLSIADDFSEIFLNETKQMMADAKLIEQIRDMSFDFCVVDSFFLSPYGLVLPYYAGIPFAYYAAIYEPWQARVPALPSFYIVSMANHIPNVPRLSFIQRLQNLIFTWMFGHELFRGAADKSLLQKYAPGVTSYHQLISQSKLFLIGMDHILEDPAPTMPNVISMPSFSARPSQPLSGDLANFFDRAEHGVVLVSFGSMGGFLPENQLHNFIDVFSTLEENILWKFDESKLSQSLKGKLPSNVKMLQWVPQNDVLGHPKTKLFITHCGNSGQYEAVYHGVPMLGFPHWAEQFHNCDRAERKGLAVCLDLMSFTNEQLVSSLKRLKEGSVTETVKKRSAIMRDGPPAGEIAVHWIEHVMKYGDGHLRSRAMEMPLYEFLMLDLYGFIFAILLIVTILLLLAVQVIVKKLLYKKQKSKVA